MKPIQLTKRQRFFNAILALLIPILMSCGDATVDPVEQVMTEISGTVTFLNDLPPDGRVHVFVWGNWPSRNAPLFDVSFVLRGISQDYKFENVAKRDYAAITAGWAPDDSSLANTVIGVYWAFPDSVGADGSDALLGAPASVTISNDAPVADNLNFTADFGLIK